MSPHRLLARSRIALLIPLLGLAAGVTAAGAAARGTHAGSAATDGVPHYNHVFMMIEENHGYQDIIGNPAAPTLNKLAQEYGQASQYYGVTHPSGPNYVAMLGGGTFGVNSDDPYWTFGVNAQSLTDQLDHARLSWKGYYQGMPYTGYRAYCHPVRCLGVPDSDTMYIAKHNGAVYFPGVNRHPAEEAKMHPLAQLNGDLASGHVPNFSYIIPDECHDMHGAPPVCVDSGNNGDVDDNWLVSTADAFVAQTVHDITNSRVWKQGRDAIVINFDEGDDNAGCCNTNPGGGRALAIVITNRGPRHVNDTTQYNHYGLLRTLEDAFRVPCLAGACDSQTKAMAPLFAASPGQRPAAVPESLLAARKRLDPNPPVGVPPAAQPGADPNTSGPAAPAVQHGGWQVVPAPNLSSHDNNLAAVSASSPSDAWAVGDYYTESNPNVFRNLAEHWDGTRWTAVAPPNVGSQENTLFGVSALPGGRAWAVGYYADDRTYQVHTLAEYYDGTQWNVVPTANPARARDVLFSVKVVSPSDVWAVGYQENGWNQKFSTLIEHWNGQRWTVVPSPNPGRNGNQLFGVTAAGPGDAYAVGQQLGRAFPSLALTEHWDGQRWHVVASPRSSSRSYDPYAASIFGGKLLAAGDQENDITPQTPLAYSGPDTIPADTVGSGENDFYGLAAAGQNAWAAGRVTDAATTARSPLIERYANGRFSVVSTPNPGADGGGAGFGGVDVLPDGQGWAVGAYNTSTSANQVLIERYVP